MCPWQVPWQGLSKCGREGGERFNPHSSASSRHSPCALRGCLEGADPGPRQQGTVTSSLFCFPAATASKILQTTHFTYFTFLLSSRTRSTLNLRQGNAPTLSPHGVPENSAHSHNPMVSVLAFPYLEHVLSHWDVTSLNTYFLSPCFWFPLWIEWPANNAAQWCVCSLALITASCPAANPQASGVHAHPKLRNMASGYRHLHSNMHSEDN